MTSSHQQKCTCITFWEVPQRPKKKTWPIRGGGGYHAPSTTGIDPRSLSWLNPSAPKAKLHQANLPGGGMAVATAAKPFRGEGV